MGRASRPADVKTPTERLVFVSLGVAIVGLGVILAPRFSAAASASRDGPAVGVVAGLCYAGFQLLVKGLRASSTPSTIVIVECTARRSRHPAARRLGVNRAGWSLEPRDWVAAIILGLLCTAVAYTIWVEGVSRLPVQHSAILGFLTPVVAPLFAWLLLGEAVTLPTALGGVLIIAAGILVVVFGREEIEGEIPL